MSTYTPGPWMIDPSNVGARWNVATRDDDVALAQQLIGDDLKQSRRSANARLIAAAPDLLAALKALTVLSLNGSQWCFRTKNSIPMGMSKKQEKLVRAAIAKAEGR